MNASDMTKYDQDDRDPEHLAILEQMRSDPGYEVTEDIYDGVAWELAHRQ